VNVTKSETVHICLMILSDNQVPEHF